MPTLEYVLKVRAELQADASVEQTTELYEMFNQLILHSCGTLMNESEPTTHS